MTRSASLTVLVADTNDADRKAIADLLTLQGFRVMQAIDGGTAIKVIEEQNIDIAIVAERMTPKSGFDFARHLIVSNRDIGVIMVTDEPTTDLLLEVSKFEIRQLMRKPVDPDRLIKTVRHMLRSYGKNPDALGEVAKAPVFAPADLMRRAIALAHQNARGRMGGPFGAVIADEEGHIIGEGVNSVSLRCDPTAHAEILAIRQATDRKGKTDLSGCALYSSSQPTMLGQALIISTGISKVYYGLSHEEVAAWRKREEGDLMEMKTLLSRDPPPYEQMQHDEAWALFS